MAEYNVLAKVDQIVTKEVEILVTASSEEEAMAKAREALQTYPEKVLDNSVRRILTNKSHYWIPRDIQFVKVEEEKKTA